MRPVRDLSGKNVFVTAAGGRVAVAEAADITDRDAVRRLADRVTAASGPMDVVLDVAGIAIWGTVHVTEEPVPPMVDGGRGGQLVNV